MSPVSSIARTYQPPRARPQTRPVEQEDSSLKSDTAKKTEAAAKDAKTTETARAQSNTETKKTSGYQPPRARPVETQPKTTEAKSDTKVNTDAKVASKNSEDTSKTQAPARRTASVSPLDERQQARIQKAENEALAREAAQAKANSPKTTPAAVSPQDKGAKLDLRA